MTIKDLHEEAFDEATLVKLSLFQKYLKDWLPTFIMQKQITEINIFDSFAGPGYDITKKPGSPMLILSTINEFLPHLRKYPTKINIYLNEYNLEKFEKLEENVGYFLKKYTELENYININLSNLDFEKHFSSIEVMLKKKIPNLVFLDQNGVKWVSDNRFKELISINITDFLFFVSSGHIARFHKEPTFLKHLGINANDIEKAPHEFIHRVVLNHYKKLIPDGNETLLFPFSLKKGLNIHGLIFGASSLRACDKFLHRAWKENPINGEANFDIDKDIEKQEEELFPEHKAKSKKELFQENTGKEIVNRNIKNNLELYEFTLKSGHLPEHSREVLKNLKGKGKIKYSGSIAVSFQAWQKGKIHSWEVV